MTKILSIVICILTSSFIRSQCDVGYGLLKLERIGSKEIKLTSNDSICISEFCDRIKRTQDSVNVVTIVSYGFPKYSKNVTKNAMSIKSFLIKYGLSETRILFKFYESKENKTSLIFSGGIFR
jgi:hypothetical protein